MCPQVRSQAAFPAARTTDTEPEFMRSMTSFTPDRRTRRLVERRARRRPAILAGAAAVGVLTLVGFAGPVPVSTAEASGKPVNFALASFATSAQPALAVAESTADTASTDAHDAIAAADAAVAAAATVTADIAASGLDVGVPDTSVDTAKLEDAADRLDLGIDHLPAPLLPDVTDDVTALVASVSEQVAGLRGSLDAAIALKAQQEAEEKARLEAEAAAAAAARSCRCSCRSAQASSSSSSRPTAAIPSGGGSGDNSPAGAQASAYAHAPELRLGRRPVRMPRRAVEQGVRLELPGPQPLERCLRHPAGPSWQQDGHRRRRLAVERRHPGRLGPRLHLRTLRLALRGVVALAIDRLVLIERHGWQTSAGPWPQTPSALRNRSAHPRRIGQPDHWAKGAGREAPRPSPRLPLLGSGLNDRRSARAQSPGESGNFPQR